MSKQIYRVGRDIYDASTNQRIPNPQVLQSQYSGAREVSPPNANPIIGRNADSTPGIVRPGQYGFSDWRSYQALKDAAAKIISMKNNNNKDLTASQAYWGGAARDTSPFGGKVNNPTSYTFTDPSLRKLSPADQASIRASRGAASAAALNATQAERQYRENTAGTALSNIADIYKQQVAQANNDAQLKIQKAQVDATNAYNKGRLELDQYKAGLSPYGIGDYPEGKQGIDIDTFANAIAGQESKTSGGANAVNKRTGAHGAYQILPSNWKPWSSDYTKNVLKISAESLPNTPENNEAVAKYEMSKMYKKYGNWADVASVWYSGRPISVLKAQGKYNKPAGPNGKEPSPREYVEKTLDRLGLSPNTITSNKKTSNNSFSDSDLKTYAYRINIGQNTGTPALTVNDLKTWTNQQITDALRIVAAQKKTFNADGMNPNE